MKYYFSIPDSIFVHDINVFLIKMMYVHRNWFYDDFIIESAYGAPFNCKWTSGRYTELKSDINFLKTIEFFKKNNILYRLILTNNSKFIANNLDNDTKTLLKKINDNNGFVTLISTELYKTIKQEYNNIHIYWSIGTTVDLNDDPIQQINYINQLSNTDRVVLPIHFNNSIVNLKNPDNIEMLVNQLWCIDTVCEFGKEHADFLQKECSNHSKNTIFIKCPLYKYRNLWETNLDMKIFYKNHKHIIPRQDLDLYAKNKFIHFKLVDRTDKLYTLACYLHYFIKPNYRLEFINGYQELYNYYLTDNYINNIDKVVKYYDCANFRKM